MLAARSSSSLTSPRSWISGSLTNKPIGSKRFLRKRTNGIRSTPTGSNCRTDHAAAAALNYFAYNFIKHRKGCGGNGPTKIIWHSLFALIYAPQQMFYGFRFQHKRLTDGGCQLHAKIFRHFPFNSVAILNGL